VEPSALCGIAAEVTVTVGLAFGALPWPVLVLKLGSPSVLRPFLGWLEVSAEVGIVNIGSAKNEVVVGKNEEISVYQN
jgi:hypothetical protein